MVIIWNILLLFPFGLSFFYPFRVFIFSLAIQSLKVSKLKILSFLLNFKRNWFLFKLLKFLRKFLKMKFKEIFSLNKIWVSFMIRLPRRLSLLKLIGFEIREIFGFFDHRDLLVRFIINFLRLSINKPIINWLSF